MTGKGRVWGVGEFAPSYLGPLTPSAREYAKASKVDDPSNYGPGAQWRLQLDYDF